MKVYLVGGAVRDKAMGLIPKDFDYVVVGGTPTDFSDWEMVGKDFPVYLEPTHKWEVALARRENKTGVGYSGFTVVWEGVTLEEDLARRDLTMNAMAIEVDWEETIRTGSPVCIGEIIDPYQGRKDIDRGLLRPVSDRFSEDPIRLLRAGRFLARYKRLRPSDDLWDVCKDMVRKGRLKELVPERAWKETERALGEKHPREYFMFISAFDIPLIRFLRCMKHIRENNPHHQEESVFAHTMMVLEEAGRHKCKLEVIFACLVHDIAKPWCYATWGSGHGHEEAGVDMVKALCHEWKVPKRFRDLAINVTQYHQRIHSALGRNGDSPLRPKSIMEIFKAVGALKNPEALRDLGTACKMDHLGRISEGKEVDYTLRLDFLEECLEAVLKVEQKALVAKCMEQGRSGAEIGDYIRNQQIRAIADVRNQWLKEK